MRFALAFGGVLLAALLIARVSPDIATPTIVTNSVRLDTEEFKVLGELRTKVDMLGAPCHKSFREISVTRVGEAAGGRVKAITVLRFAPGYRTAQLTGKDLRRLQETVRKVWTSKIENSSCFVNWAEITMWSIDARIDFEDGSHGVLITDGSWHVALQAHDGQSWFLRLSQIVR